MKKIGQTRWQQLSLRERRVISWGGSGLLAALLYAYLWQPLNDERIRLRDNLPQLRTNASVMALQAQETLRLRQNANAPISRTSLQAAIQKIAIETGVDSPSLQITLLNENRANINIPKITFDSWVELTARMQSEKHIRIESCSIEALTEGGMVRVQAVAETKVSAN